MVSERKAVVERYIEGFRRGDREMILDCVTDDVEWNLLGWQSLAGKDSFAGEIQNDAFVGTPELTIERMVEEDDVVVAFGAGRGRLRAGGELRVRVQRRLLLRRRPDPAARHLPGQPLAASATELRACIRT